jgi:deoxyribonuclease-1-like protein
MRQIYRIRTIFIFLLLVCSIAINAEIVIVSWNIKDFGQSRTDEEITAIAQHVRHADVLAIQEVVAIHPGGAQASARLISILNSYNISLQDKISEKHYLWK